MSMKLTTDISIHIASEAGSKVSTVVALCLQGNEVRQDLEYTVGLTEGYDVFLLGEGQVAAMLQTLTDVLAEIRSVRSGEFH